MKFKDKVVLVTGASRGIGKAIALMFAKEGAKVVINYSKSQEEARQVLNQVKKLSEGMVVGCDVSNEERVKIMIETIIKRYDRLDILVNNVGQYIDGDEWNGTSKIWDKTLKINLISAMNTSKYAAEIFQKQKSGLIINIASIRAVESEFDCLAYAAAKAGMVSITQSYAKLLAPYGRANAISPGPVNAGYWLRAPKEELEATMAKMPNKKLIEPEEVASKVLELCSESSKMTGQNIIMSGK